ncbi:FAD-binding and (Fe-S)-binding domain-containing protein [Alteromonas sp. ASW11-36]|uniref:FAD-binding and (Fe-S)-binding domain-containing protein n=1 Tax=Alteromonas arenosi TaxID=3055817 RepID=A0ABT7SWL4_9ALTE|nr:FAD-binding and (Fe-S)-binding domain-containing protein [Alteromonas sp. ASW11-36]MDM7860573.1 FAD-binding and (Fe-S)-binding domain-containing protein [Alteromonas sp. ASW11-36]
MLPVVPPESAVAAEYLEYLEALRDSNFSGDIEHSYSSRLAVATDNSIYQKMPQAVIYPKSVEDLTVVGQLAASRPDIQFSARGGGTGTNGQSLTSGIVVDISRHLNNVLEINVEERWVRVEAGVVKDALNDFLRPYGFFFSPDLSTSNRATIGGMINTDASGQGSLVYGKTSDHVLALKAVLANGEVLDTQSIACADVKNIENQCVQTIYAQLVKSCIHKRDAILAKFPRLNRFLTGYDLEHAASEDLSSVDATRILTGSEGSLAFIAEAKLDITPIPKHKALVNVKYDSFESALRHAPAMVAANATSVETVDSNVLDLARTDIIWHSISDLITDVPNKTLLGLNMVEYNSEDLDEIEQRIATLSARLDAEITAGETGVIGYQVTFDTADIAKIYAMRKKAVGLLGKTKGSRKPIAFAEDTAVPPENLADFIMEFRALLDSHDLHYGMFGHVDAGVLHVRPALDMCDPEQEKLMLKLSDQVVELVAKYGGLMWGEHGKGYRSEYGPAFFGDELFTELRKIKAAFDPHNQMNPGKICTPINSDAGLVKVADAKRGHLDKTIPISFKEPFEPAMSCNGNGLCFNYDTTSPMCPSSKITQDRRHSPKGRAGMIREWLRLLNNQGVSVKRLEAESFSTSLWERWINTRKTAKTEDFSHEVLEVMDGCLACKSCSSQCPVGVDVPDFRAKFLSIYYQRYMRPFKDYFVANVEWMAPLMAKTPLLFNTMLKPKWARSLLQKTIGYVDAPVLSVPNLKQRVESLVDDYSYSQLASLSDAERAEFVLIVQDPFTSFYDAEVVKHCIDLIAGLGLKPVVLPFKPNGKPQHVKGFLERFERTAKSTAAFLNQVHQLNIPMIGVDASLVLCYRDEYTKTLAEKRGDFSVKTVQEWLTEYLAERQEPLPQLNDDNTYVLLSHCTEKTALPASERQWQAIFSAFNLQLTPTPVGCCGMAGTYGHEQQNLANSRGIYDLSWRPVLAKTKADVVLATGYSCRSQVARFEQYKPLHPLQIIAMHLQETH